MTRSDFPFPQNSVQNQKMVSVLFVCLGNICRSPAAEGIFSSMVAKKGQQEHFAIDSAGTSGYHMGQPADHRMREHAKKRGYQLLSRSRPFCHPKDFEQFDCILAMDNSNQKNLEALTNDPQYLKKIYTMMSFAPEMPEKEVPDPYYGGDQGFERVLDILEEACKNLLANLEKKLPHPNP